MAPTWSPSSATIPPASGRVPTGRRESSAQPVLSEALHEGLEALGLAWQCRHHLADLVGQHRHQQDQRQGHQNRRPADNQDRRPGTVQAACLQAVGDRVQEIGNDNGRHERQQDVPEQRDDEHEDNQRRHQNHSCL